jgi:hypothetical protein
MLFVEGKDGATKYLLHRKPNGSYELHEPPSTSSNTSLEEMAQGLLQDAKRQPVKNFDNTEEALKYL